MKATAASSCAIKKKNVCFSARIRVWCASADNPRVCVRSKCLVRRKNAKKGYLGFQNPFENKKICSLQKQANA